MKTFGLTPKSNSTVLHTVFTGSFGQPDGFGSVLELIVNTEGHATLNLHYKADLCNGPHEHFWAVILEKNIVAAIESQSAGVHWFDLADHFENTKPKTLMLKLEQLAGQGKIAEVRYICNPRDYVIRRMYLPIGAVVSLFDIKEGIFGEKQKGPG